LMNPARDRIAESACTRADLIALDIASRNPCSVRAPVRGGASGIARQRNLGR
jgi:hypothetical protein